MSKEKDEKDLERTVVYQILTPAENLFMVLREDDKFEIGCARAEVQNVSGA